MHYNHHTQELYDLYNLIIGFCIKYEMWGHKYESNLRQILSESLGQDERPLEAAIGQFIAQLNHINRE